jgi:chorismate mutase/prephenate dehydratase
MKETIEQQLKKIRIEIDAIDDEVLRLIKSRAEVASKVAKIKQQDSNATYYRPEREAQVLTSIMEKNDSLLPDKAVAQIFRDIMTACLALQKPLTIGYLGPQGTFTQMAAEKHFGKAAGFEAIEGINEVFHQVESKQIHYGVVPIENSSEGMVNLTLDSFLNSSVQICGEIELRVNHQFLRNKNANKTVKRIYSHQQSLAQCRQWITKHHPQAELREVSSNGLAAKMAAEDKDSAAISSQRAADQYALEVIAQDIEDSRHNTTRFIILGTGITAPSGNDKTSILISSPHKPGGLVQILMPFEKNKISMTMIESRPYKHRNWSYLFFIDIEGHQQEKHVKKALEELAQMSIMMNILGSYPKALS